MIVKPRYGLPDTSGLADRISNGGNLEAKRRLGIVKRAIMETWCPNLSTFYQITAAIEFHHSLRECGNCYYAVVNGENYLWQRSGRRTIEVRNIDRNEAVRVNIE